MLHLIQLGLHVRLTNLGSVELCTDALYLGVNLAGAFQQLFIAASQFVDAVALFATNGSFCRFALP